VIVNKSWLLVMAMAMALVGCRVSPEAAADPVGFNLDQAFSLRGGQEAATNDGTLRIRFDEVLEDSRCPTEVECFWTGQARIAILVEPTGRERTTAEFNTNPAPGQNVMKVRVGEYMVELWSLDPYPRTPDERRPLADYSATLLVRNAA
jgi:hypothetical protein